MGGLDWKFTMLVRDQIVSVPFAFDTMQPFPAIYLSIDAITFVQAMWLANLVCVGMIRAWANAGVMTLGKIWWALAVSAIVISHAYPTSVGPCHV